MLEDLGGTEVEFSEIGAIELRGGSGRGAPCVGPDPAFAPALLAVALEGPELLILAIPGPEDELRGEVSALALPEPTLGAGSPPDCPPDCVRRFGSGGCEPERSVVD